MTPISLHSPLHHMFLLIWFWYLTALIIYIFVQYLRKIKRSYIGILSLAGVVLTTPARYEPVSTYLEPQSRTTHARHPPILDIKANSCLQQSPTKIWPDNRKSCDSICKAMRELVQQHSNFVTASMIMAPCWDITVSSPSAKCDLYSRSYNYSVCTTGLYCQILIPLNQHQVIRF